MGGDLERQGKKDTRLGSKEYTERHRQPPFLASGLLHGSFLKESERGAAQHSLSPIRHPKAGATYAT